MSHFINEMFLLKTMSYQYCIINFGYIFYQRNLRIFKKELYLQQYFIRARFMFMLHRRLHVILFTAIKLFYDVNTIKPICAF